MNAVAGTSEDPTVIAGGSEEEVTARVDENQRAPICSLGEQSLLSLWPEGRLSDRIELLCGPLVRANVLAKNKLGGGLYVRLRGNAISPLPPS